MEVIDGTWILNRLPRHHGAKGELADAIGMDRDKLAKVLQGKRRLTPQEIAKIVQHFADSPPPSGSASGRDPVPGFRDEAEPFRPAPTAASPRGPVHAIFGDAAVTPEITHRARLPLPELFICPGDQIVCDLSRPPRVGEMVVVDVADAATGETISHLIRRYFPPFLTGGGAGISTRILRETDAGIFIRYPVIGVLRTPHHEEAPD